jgi:hypothetical protein
VQLGAYDQCILLWLAGWEPATCAVIAGLITRAHRAGKAGTAKHVPLDPGRLATVLRALADAIAHHTGRADARRKACMTHPAGLWDPYANDLDQAAAHRAVERQLIDQAAG